MHMKSWATSIAWAVLAASSAAQVTLTVNAQDGEVVEGERQFRVRVQSQHLVTQVEFYVNDSLRATDESTPYEFTLDTLAEPEGPITLMFAAFNVQGESARRTVRLRIDNGLGRGIDYFVNLGRTHLGESRWDDAILAGRRALKIDPQNTPGRIILARANLGKRVLDTAQKFVEDVLAAEPGNREALELSAGINLRKGFAALEGTANPTAALASASRSIQAAVTARRTSIDAQVDAFGAVSDANLPAYADLMMLAGRYSIAIERLNASFARDMTQTEVGNRLAYAQIRAGRTQDAYSTLRSLGRFGTPDAYSHALRAILMEYAGDREASLAAEREAILDDPAHLGVRTAQVFLALQRNDRATMAQLVSALVRDAGGRTEVNTYLSAAHFILRQEDQARQALMAALLADPANYEAFVEAANQSVSRSLVENVRDAEVNLQRETAVEMLQAALIARPESFQALTCLALVRAFQGRHEEAVTTARAATAAGPTYGPAFYALAAVASAARPAGTTPDAQRRAEALLTEARNAMTRARELDARRLSGRGIPTLQEAWAFFNLNGRLPMLTPPAVRE